MINTESRYFMPGDQMNTFLSIQIHPRTLFTVVGWVIYFGSCAWWATIPLTEQLGAEKPAEARKVQLFTPK